MIYTSKNARKKTYQRITTASLGTYGGQGKPERNLSYKEHLMEYSRWRQEHKNSVGKVFYVPLHSLSPAMIRCGVRSRSRNVADVDQQALAVAGKATFRNCLVAMRPKVSSLDLPSTHDVSMYIHNEFVECLRKLKDDINASNLNCTINNAYLDNTECSWEDLLDCRRVDCRQHESVVFGGDGTLD
jgi:hypothetical protein